MKLESSLDRTPALLHLAPLLDVMGLMVVFYLLGSTFIHHSGFSIEPAVSDSQLPPLGSSHVALLTAGDPPLVVFDRTRMPVPDLLKRLQLKERPEGAQDAIYFMFDQRIPSGTTTSVLNAALMSKYKVYYGTVAPPASIPAP